MVQSEMRRLLIVTTKFYPDPVVGGVRMTQWARHLPKFGWKPHVLTRDYGHRASSTDLQEAIHPAVELDYFDRSSLDMRVPPAGRFLSRWTGQLKVKTAKAARYLPFAVPDVSIAFWRSTHTRLARVVEQVAPDAVLTTSPPHSIHDAGLWLVSQYPDLPWVADFRDPYLIDDRYRPRGIGRLRWPSHVRFEKAVYQRASLIVHAIPIHHRFSRMRYPDRRAAMRLLPNGCPTELLQGELEPVDASPERVSVRVVGSPGDREVLILARALRELLDEGLDAELRVVGFPPGTAPRIEKILGRRVELTGPVRHGEALRQIVGADLLASLTSPERARTLGLSSKLFEYAAVDCPKLLVNPTKSDRHFFSDWPGLWLLDEPAVAEMKTTIQRALESRAEVRDEYTGWFSRYAERFDRRVQTERLAGWLDTLVTGDRD